MSVNCYVGISCLSFWNRGKIVQFFHKVNASFSTTILIVSDGRLHFNSLDLTSFSSFKSRNSSSIRVMDQLIK